MANTKVRTILSSTPRIVEDAAAANRFKLMPTHRAPGTNVSTERRIIY
jgi:hypothetical protein